MIAYVILALMGFAFGYILPGWPAFLPVVIPVLLFVGTGLNEGWDGDLFIRLLVAVVITVVAILVGRAVASARGEKPVSAS